MDNQTILKIISDCAFQRVKLITHKTRDSSNCTRQCKTVDCIKPDTKDSNVVLMERKDGTIVSTDRFMILEWPTARVYDQLYSQFRPCKWLLSQKIPPVCRIFESVLDDISNNVLNHEGKIHLKNVPFYCVPCPICPSSENHVTLFITEIQK